MRHALRRDLYPTASLAALTLGLMVHLASGGAHAVRRPARTRRALPPAGVAWTAPPFHLAPVARETPPRGAAVRARETEPAEAPAAPETSAPESASEDLSGDCCGISGEYEGWWGDETAYGHGGYRHWAWRRYTGRRGVWRPRPAYGWMGASPGAGVSYEEGEGARSVCEVVPALCGELRRPTRRAAAAPSPALDETAARITLSNEHMEINVARVAGCVVRVRRAAERADTLLTFDLPDELVPCEVSVTPDVFHDDGVAVRIDARTPRWTQSMTVALGAGDDTPTVAITRATREGATVSHALVNASAQPLTFTVDGRDVSVEPGEVARVSSR